jgi:drug/metabolite transporter (DMT)-like permease
MGSPAAEHATAEERRGLAYAAAAAIIYGIAYPATAIALRSFSPLAIAGIACTIALPIVIGLAAAGLLPRPTVGDLRGPRLLRLIVLSSLGGLLFIAATNAAVALSGSTITGFVTPLYAVAAAVLAVPILGERLRWTAVAAFALAIVGTGLLAGVAPDLDAGLGVAAALVAALAFGLYIVLARRWAVPYRLDGTLVTIGNLIGRGPVLLVVELIRTSGALVPADPDPAAVLAILVIAVGPSSAANLLLMASVRRVPAGRTSAALLLTPISSAVVGALLLSDHLAPIQLAGAGLILVGIAVASGLVGGRRGRTPVASDAAAAADAGPG